MNSILDKRAIVCLAAAVMSLLLASPARSQEFRGSITGRVLDQNGSGVPGAEIAVTNLQTNVSTTARSEQGGEYTVLYLIPGQYRIVVTMRGFKTLVRSGIEVRVADKLGIDLQLEVGTVQETVTINSEQPILESTNASSGQIIDRRRITELPLGDGNPTMLTRIAVGVTATGSFGAFNQPFSNFGPSSLRVDGAPGENEWTINGFPHMSLARKVGFNLPSESVTEFKMQNSSYDAQTGHTGAAVINDSLRSGTNKFHGSIYEFIRNDALNANEFFRNRAGLPRAPLRYDRYGGSASGPVRIPKLYNGHDKTFFFFTYEHLYDNFPETNTFSVPTAAERNGDFTDLLASFPNSKIYDPFTATLSGSTVTRQQICIKDAVGNCKAGTLNMIDPARISSIAKSYLQFIPLPNLPGVQNNFVGSPANIDRFNTYVIHIDHNLSKNQRISFHYLRNGLHQLRGGWTNEVNGVQPSGQEFFRQNNVVGYDHVITFSPTTVLDTRIGYSRFLELSLPRSLGKFDPSTMGFSAQTLTLFQGYQYVPTLTINQYLPPTSFFGGALGKNVGGPAALNTYVVQPTLTKITGAHSLRFGYDFRAYLQNQSGPGDVAGKYDFQADFTKQTSSASAQFGQTMAAFLLGLPTNASYIDRNVAGASYKSLYHGVFVHDDWKATSHLTVNLGLRLEYEPPTTERFNRNVRGFDTTSSNPIESAARTAYTTLYNANPGNFQIPPDQFHVLGGYLFAGSNQRGIWQTGPANIEPRLGAAYRLGQKTVLRGGYGIFIVSFFADGSGPGPGGTNVPNQTGFSLQTFVVPTNNSGLTFNPNNCTSNCWANPFPNGAATPPGSSLGLGTLLGQAISPVVPLDRRNGRVQHFSFDIQRELPWNWVVDVGYFATRGSRLNIAQPIDPVARQYLSTSAIRDDATINFLGGLVGNPFAGLLPGSSLNGATIARSQLLRPFPEFSSISREAYIGRSWYDSLQIRVERRFANGFTLQGGYTFSKLFERTTFLNETDPLPEKRIAPNDVTHRVVLNGIWELPFGHGRKWGAHWNKVVNAVAGGWQVGPSFQAQSGFPITLGNIVFMGDLRTLRTNISSSTVDGAFPTTGFYFTDAAVQTNGVPDPAKQRADTRIRLASNIRTLPSTLPWFRGHNQNNWDVAFIKKFAITEQLNLQLRCETFNLFNRTQFNAPSVDPTSTSFTKITAQANTPGRYIQFAAKLVF